MDWCRGVKCIRGKENLTLSRDSFHSITEIIDRRQGSDAVNWTSELVYWPVSSSARLTLWGNSGHTVDKFAYSLLYNGLCLLLCVRVPCFGEHSRAAYRIPLWRSYRTANNLSLARDFHYTTLRTASAVVIPHPHLHRPFIFHRPRPVSLSPRSSAQAFHISVFATWRIKGVVSAVCWRQ